MLSRSATARLWTGLLAVVVSLACGETLPQQQTETPVMHAVRTFYQVYNDHDPGLWTQAVAPSYVAHVNRQTIPDRTAGAAFVTTLLNAFPDIQFTIADSVEANDRVAVRWTATGTHKGELFGVAPTGKTVTMIGVTIFRVENGQVAELWDVWDEAGLMRQLQTGR